MDGELSLGLLSGTGWRRCGGFGAGAGSRRCGGFEAFEGGRRRSRNRKKRLCGHPAARGWRHGGGFRLLKRAGASRWRRCEGFGAMWKATGRRLEEPLDAAGTRSQPERALRAGPLDAAGRGTKLMA